MKILIVDDKMENLILLDTLLKGFGYQVEQASNGKEALDKLQNNSYQMIISDILMPVMDGYELCRICKTDPVLRSIIFVFYTATYTTKEDEEYALQLGADQFLIKPMEPAKFMSAISGIAKKAEEDNFFPKEPEITDAEAIRMHRDRLLNKLSKKVADLKLEIDERKKAEEALHNIQAQQSIAMKIARLEYWEYDVARDLFTFNDHFYAIFHTTAERIGGYQMSSAQYAERFVHPDDRAVVGKEIQNAIESPNPDYSSQLEHRILCADGEVGYITVRFSIVKDSQGHTIKTFGANQDITERKRTEIALRERIKELRCIVDISRLAEKPSITIEELAQRTIAILPPAWQYPDICCARITLDSKEFKTANFRETEWSQSADIKVDRKKFGVITVCYLEQKPVENEGPFFNEERSLINTVADFLGHVIQHRMSEAEIKDSEMRFKAIFNNATDGMLLADTESKKFQYANPSICSMLGYSEKEIRNLGVMDIHPEQEVPYIIEQFEKQSRNEIDVVPSLPVKRKDGSIFYADINSAPIEISGKHYLLGVFRDITERKWAEDILRERDEVIRSIVETSRDWIWSIDMNAKHTYCNPAIQDILGYKPDELVGKLSIDLLYEEDRKFIESQLPEWIARKEGWKNLILRWKHKDGSWRWLESNAVPSLNADGELIGFRGVDRDITERKQAEEERRIALVKYKTLFDCFPLGITVSDVAGNIVETNPTAEKLLSVPKDEQIKRDIDSTEWHIIRPDGTPMPAEEYASVQALKQKRKVENVEMGIVKPDNTITWINVTAAPLPLEGHGVVIIYNDITERKRAEETLQESEQRFHRLFAASPEAIMLLDPSDPIVDWPIVDCNEIACRMNGYTREELIGKSVNIFNISAGTPEERANYMEHLKSEGVVHLETFHRHRDGHIFPIEVSTTIVTVKGRKLVLGIDRDITERKQAEETILKERSLLMTLIDNLPTGIFVKDRDYRKIIVNPVHLSEVRGHLKFLKKNHDIDILGKTDFEVFPKELAEKFYADDRKVILDGSSIINHEEFGVQPDGKQNWLLVSKVPLRDQDGSITGMVGITNDITERKLDEEAIRSANKRLRLLHQISETVHETLEPDIIFKRITDAFVKSMGFSTALVLTIDENEEHFHVRSLTTSRLYLTGINKILGFPLKKFVFPVSDIIGSVKNAAGTSDMIIVNRLADIAHPPLSKTACNALEKLGNSKSFILIPLVLEGKLIGGMLVSSALEQAPKTDIDMLGTFASTAIQAIANAELLAKTNKAREQAHKSMEEKEILLRELYHRTKNNMQVISAMLRLKARSVGDKELQYAFHEVETKIRTMALVHQRLYQSKDLSSLNLKNFIQDLIVLIRQSYLIHESQIQIVCNAVDAPALIDTAIPLGLVLNELITNAIKHAFPGGRRGKIRVNLGVGRKRELYLEVSDNGVGFPEGFDIEKNGRLGLGTIQDLIRHQLDGEVTFENKNGLTCRIVIQQELYKPRV